MVKLDRVQPKPKTRIAPHLGKRDPETEMKRLKELVSALSRENAELKRRISLTEPLSSVPGKSYLGLTMAPGDSVRIAGGLIDVLFKGYVPSGTRIVVAAPRDLLVERINGRR